MRKQRNHPGIRARHRRSCPAPTGGSCRCQPSYEAWAYSARDGQKIRKTFPTLAAAKGWRADAISAIRKGSLKTPTRVTVREAAEAFIDGIETETILSRNGVPYKPSVVRAYATDLKNVVIPELGAQRLSDLRRSDVQALVDRLVGAGTSPSRIHGIIMPLRAICRRAIERDEITVNPTTNVRLPAATGTRERVATPAEAAELFAALCDEDRALYSTAFYAGLRRGELQALRWNDIDLPNDRISVSRSWDEKAGPIEPKSKKSTRVVPITSELRRRLVEHKVRTGRDGDDLVFGSTRTHPFTPSALRRRAVNAWKVANKKRTKDEQPLLEPIGLHECRHSYVSWMADAGVSLEQIGDYVGHGSTYMTDRYRHLLVGHETRTLEVADAYLAQLGKR